jgi:lysylphosphatidylglycerol synthetase-like protein (DUF2156 family)
MWQKKNATICNVTKQMIVINKVIAKVISPYALIAKVSFLPRFHYLHYDHVTYIMFAFTFRLNTKQQIKNQLFIFIKLKYIIIWLL